MKKIYIMALAIGAFSFSSYAQIIDLEDDFESYSQGPISEQADHWRTWSGDEGEEQGTVSAEQAASGSLSMKIGPGVADGGPQDQLLLVDFQPDSGIYTAQFKMFVPTDMEGYFNTQGTLTAPQGGTANIGGNIFFNRDGLNNGVGVRENFEDPDEEFSFPQNQWFTIRVEYNLDDRVFDMFIDGTLALDNSNFVNAAQSYIGALDFFAGGPATTFFIDDVILAQGRLGVDDLTAKAFSVYPNPVKDVLNIKSKASVDNVTVYDILGKVVLQENPGKISPAINMSSLATGSYLVKVTIGNSSKTVKVLK